MSAVFCSSCSFCRDSAWLAHPGGRSMAVSVRRSAAASKGPMPSWISRRIKRRSSSLAVTVSASALRSACCRPRLYALLASTWPRASSSRSSARPSGSRPGRTARLSCPTWTFPAYSGITRSGCCEVPRDTLSGVIPGMVRSRRTNASRRACMSTSRAATRPLSSVTTGCCPR